MLETQAWKSFQEALRLESQVTGTSKCGEASALTSWGARRRAGGSAGRFGVEEQVDIDLQNAILVEYNICNI